MKRKKFIYTCGKLTVLSVFVSCKKWLDREPHTIILDEQVWNDPKMILGILANLYDRLPTDTSLTGPWRNMANYMDAMWSGQSNEDWRNDQVNYSYDLWRLWDYSFIRDINLALDGLANESKNLEATTISQFNAEFRFLRAFMYFEMVKRMGGVPLVTGLMEYDFNGDPTPLQVPRSKESEVYDFIETEIDDIADKLGNAGSVSRANKFTALALKSRAMLYAASIAKFNNEMASPIGTPNGEVGIPIEKAEGYYRSSLSASQEILTSGNYKLYQTNPNLGENFYEAVTDKIGNNEIIFVKDASEDKKHFFSYDNIARGAREDNLGSSSMTPSLNLVESFPYTDGSNGDLKNRTSNNIDYIYYNEISDIFKDKDARLYGTLIYPGTTFKGIPIQIQAGVKVWNASKNDYDTIEGNSLGENYTDNKLLTGSSGPHRSIQEVSDTGFYMRKYIDSTPMSSSRGIQSQMWWVWFRLGEIYLNAAEAAFELGLIPDSVEYIKQLRARAGFDENSISEATIDRDTIRNEFRCELAFEDHHIWDLKRWRIAHIKWDGDSNNKNDMIYALYPYRVIKPGDPQKDGKYVFDKIIAPRFRSPRFFRMGNYYSSIAQSTLDSNPKIIKNPFH